ncbi:hypothetical protein [Cohnella sp. 56]|uniref:hypothetical protein n=1 Tax=Cohnella sp. 56 TaxID=3113722 RepID=UPI0030E7CE41
MKKLLAGTALLAAGIGLYLTAYVQASRILPQIGQWPTAKGRLWVAYREVGAVAPSRFGILLCVVGIALLLWGTFEQELAALWRTSAAKIKENLNQEPWAETPGKPIDGERGDEPSRL